MSLENKEYICDASLSKINNKSYICTFQVPNDYDYFFKEFYKQN